MGGRKRRYIRGLKKIHELGIKTYVSVEPWIPEVTKPLAIMSALKDWVDRWIIGALNYFGWDRYCHEVYRKEMPKLLQYVAENGINVMWKKELKPFLKG